MSNLFNPYHRTFEQLKNERYTFVEKISAFFHHLRIMLFASGDERRVYAETFDQYKRWKNQN